MVQVNLICCNGDIFFHCTPLSLSMSFDFPVMIGATTGMVW